MPSVYVFRFLEGCASGFGAALVIVIVLLLLRSRQSPDKKSTAEKLMADRNSLDAQKVALLNRIANAIEQSESFEDKMRVLHEREAFLEWKERTQKPEAGEEWKGEGEPYFCATKYVAGFRFEYFVSYCKECPSNHWSAGLEDDGGNFKSLGDFDSEEEAKAEAVKHLRSVVTGVPV